MHARIRYVTSRRLVAVPLPKNRMVGTRYIRHFARTSKRLRAVAALVVILFRADLSGVDGWVRRGSFPGRTFVAGRHFRGSACAAMRW
jgi:hypothetical protein